MQRLSLRAQGIQDRLRSGQGVSHAEVELLKSEEYARRGRTPPAGFRRFQEEDLGAAPDASGGRQGLVDQLAALGVTISDTTIGEDILQQLLDLLQAGGGAAAPPPAAALADDTRDQPSMATMSERTRYLLGKTKAGQGMLRKQQEQVDQHRGAAQAFAEVLDRYLGPRR